MSEQKLSSMLISIGAGLRCEVGALVSGVGGSVTREVAPMEWSALTGRSGWVGSRLEKSNGQK
jgi:hypothetical protein